MKPFKNYIKNLYKILTAITVFIAIVYFFTGKATFAEYLNSLTDYTQFNSNDVAKNTGVKSAFTFVPNSDNLLTTLLKTFFVILAILFLCIAALFTSFFELFIFLFSWGDHPFYCTKEIWSLCWNRIALNWYWLPGKSVYLTISLILFSGIFGNETRDAPRKIPTLRERKTNSRNKLRR